jgi:DNA-binding MurR/RpiR family transcriptional regulator
MKIIDLTSSLVGGLAMLSEIQFKLRPSEQKIAAYILANPKKAINCTVNELGEISEASGAAVIRLCRSLGLKGFQDLKMRIAGDLQRSNEGMHRDIQPNESEASILFKMTNNSMRAIRETSEIINPEDLSRAVDAINRAKRIHFFGVGASGIVAQDAQQKFLRINKEVTAFTDFHLAAVVAANSTPEDVVMGISYLGQTKEIVEFLELAKQLGAKTISLTRFGPSAVSKSAEINLYTSASAEAVFRSGATSSRLVQLHIIDVLFMCVATRQYEQSVQHLDQTREAIQALRITSKIPRPSGS